MRLSTHLKKSLLALVVSAVVPSMAMAETLGSLDVLSQDKFRMLTENLGAATHYKALSPAESLGIIGFDIGVELSATSIDEDLFDEASDGDFDLSRFLMPRVHVNKGLPLGFEVGATLSAVPDTDIKVLAAEVKYAFVGGGMLTPAFGVRATHARLEGLDDLDLNSSALEVSVSKGFVMLTPYGGVGLVRTTADATNASNLESETVEQNKLFVGLVINLGVALTLEVDRTGDYETLSAKAGIRF